MIVFACAEPNPDLWRIDRWIVAAESNDLEPLIVANKRDMVDEADVSGAISANLQRIGYRVIATSVKQNIGIDELRPRFARAYFRLYRAVRRGQIQPAQRHAAGLETGNGRCRATSRYKGKHTTTVRELIPLETGGWVADTPGLRQLELLSMTREELAELFRRVPAFSGNALPLPQLPPRRRTGLQPEKSRGSRANRAPPLRTVSNCWPAR